MGVKILYIEPIKENGYTFGFHISIFKGLVELIWSVRDSQNKSYTKDST